MNSIFKKSLHKSRYLIFGALIILLSLFIFASTSYAATRIGYYKMNGNYNDEEGNDIVQWVDNSSPRIPGANFTSWVSGFSGLSARTSHNGSDGAGDLLGIINYNWLNARNIKTLYIRYRLNIENSYPDFSNFKLWRSDGPYLEMSIKSLSNGYTIGSVCNTKNGYGWDEGNDFVNNPRWNVALRNNWFLVEIYFDIHSTNGTAWIKLDGIQGNTTSKHYTEGTFHATSSSWGGAAVAAPSIKASGDGGWWRIDEYEIWDGLPGPSAGKDTTPPGDVTNFAAQADDSEINLSWKNPSDSDYEGTMIRYSTGNNPYPATRTQGTLVCNRKAASNSNDSFLASGLINGTKYNFSAFTYDDSGNYSETAHVSATPNGSGVAGLPAPPTGLQIVP